MVRVTSGGFLDVIGAPAPGGFGGSSRRATIAAAGLAVGVMAVRHCIRNHPYQVKLWASKERTMPDHDDGTGTPVRCQPACLAEEAPRATAPQQSQTIASCPTSRQHERADRSSQDENHMFTSRGALRAGLVWRGNPRYAMPSDRDTRLRRKSVSSAAGSVSCAAASSDTTYLLRKAHAPRRSAAFKRSENWPAHASAAASRSNSPLAKACVAAAHQRLLHHVLRR